MYYPESRQTIENILVGLRRDILILSIKKHTLTTTAIHLIGTLDAHLPKMVDHVRKIFIEDTTELSEAMIFYTYLLEVYEEAFGKTQLPDILENNETDMVELVKNQFVQIIREIDKEINKISE